MKCSGGRDDNYCASAFLQRCRQGDMVSPVADRDSRDQGKRGSHVVRMASVGNKTAELAEGRGGSVKKTLALLSRTQPKKPIHGTPWTPKQIGYPNVYPEAPTSPLPTEVGGIHARVSSCITILLYHVIKRTVFTSFKFPKIWFCITIII